MSPRAFDQAQLPMTTTQLMLPRVLRRLPAACYCPSTRTVLPVDRSRVPSFRSIDRLRRARSARSARRARSLDRELSLLVFSTFLRITLLVLSSLSRHSTMSHRSRAND